MLLPAAACSICCSSSLTAWGRQTLNLVKILGKPAGPSGRSQTHRCLDDKFLKVCASRLTCSALHSFKGLLSQFSTGLKTYPQVSRREFGISRWVQPFLATTTSPKSSLICKRIMVLQSCDLHTTYIEYLDQNCRRICQIRPLCPAKCSKGPSWDSEMIERCGCFQK